MRRKQTSLSVIIALIIMLAATIVVTLTQFGNFGIAQGQVNITSLTPEQKDAICNPNNPSSNLKPVNTTESKICGIPKTVKPHLSNMTSAAAANTTSSENTTAESIAPSASSIAPSSNTTTGAEAPSTNLAPSAVPPPSEGE